MDDGNDYPCPVLPSYGWLGVSAPDPYNVSTGRSYLYNESGKARLGDLERGS